MSGTLTPLAEHDRAIGAILSAIRELMQPKVTVPKRRPHRFYRRSRYDEVVALCRVKPGPPPY
jgi:hypothetical protein